SGAVQRETRQCASSILNSAKPRGPTFHGATPRMVSFSSVTTAELQWTNKSTGRGYERDQGPPPRGFVIIPERIEMGRASVGPDERSTAPTKAGRRPRIRPQR